jgi:hypothetical protein
LGVFSICSARSRLGGYESNTIPSRLGREVCKEAKVILSLDWVKVVLFVTLSPNRHVVPDMKNRIPGGPGLPTV